MFGVQKRQIESRSLEVFLFAIVLAYHTKKTNYFSLSRNNNFNKEEKFSPINRLTLIKSDGVKSFYISGSNCLSLLKIL